MKEQTDREKYADFCLERYNKKKYPKLSKKAFRERLLKEFDTISRYPDVRAITIDGNTITVNTGRIKSRRGSVKDYGPFDIKISAYRSKSVVRFMALDPRVYRHPHMGANGWACLGNIRSPVSKLARAREFGPLILLLIEYIKQPRY